MRNYLSAKGLFKSVSSALRANAGFGLDDPEQHTRVTLRRVGHAEAGIQVTSDQPSMLERLAANIVLAHEVEVAVRDGFATDFYRFIRTRRGWRELTN